jgi:hypothetical protein
MISQEDLDAMGYSYYTEIKHMTVEEMVRKLRQQADSALHPRLLREEIDYYVRKWHESRGNAQELEALAYIMWCIYELCYSKGYNISEALQRVFRDDMAVYGMQTSKEKFTVDDLVNEDNDE